MGSHMKLHLTCDGMRNQAREKRNKLSKDSFTGKDPEPGTIETELLQAISGVLFQFWCKVLGGQINEPPSLNSERIK